MTGIIVGIDSSEVSARALDRALLEAERVRQPVHVVHAWTSALWAGMAGMGMMPLPVREDSRRAAAAVLEEVVEKAQSRRTTTADLTTTSEIVEGDPARVLCALGAQAGLLVVGGSGHGQLASAMLGSVATYVLHHAACPVMVVPAGHHSPRFARVVVGVDGSPSSRAALEWGLAVAADSGCRLTAIHAWTNAATPALHPFSRPEQSAVHEEAVRAWLAEEMKGPGTRHDTVIASQQTVYGPTAGALLEEVGPDDLLVLGSRGHGGFSSLLLGSVASQCAAHARGTVVVVKAPTA